MESTPAAKDRLEALPLATSLANRSNKEGAQGREATRSQNLIPTWLKNGGWQNMADEKILDELI